MIGPRTYSEKREDGLFYKRFPRGNLVNPSVESIKKQVGIASQTLGLPFKGNLEFIASPIKDVAFYDPNRKAILLNPSVVNEGYILHEAVHAVMDFNNLLLRVTRQDDRPFLIFSRLFNDTVAELTALNVYGMEGKERYNYDFFTPIAGYLRKVQNDVRRGLVKPSNADFLKVFDEVADFFSNSNFDQMYYDSLLVHYSGRFAIECADSLYDQGVHVRDFRFKKSRDKFSVRKISPDCFPSIYFSLFERQDV